MCFVCVGHHGAGSCNFSRMSGDPGQGWGCLYLESLILTTTQRDSSPVPADHPQTHPTPVSYTHLTLPTNSLV